MLKINSQLKRALRYQAVIGSERNIGHFDDGAKDLAGPPPRNALNDVSRLRRAKPMGVVTDDVMISIDPVSGGYIAVVIEAH